MGGPMSRWVRRVVKALGLAFLVAAALGFTYEQIGRRQDNRHRFRIGRAVDVGGYSLNIDCSGSGSPAVILESGGGGYGGYGWRVVQSEVAKFTTVCWYDRAGEGWSDSAPTARNSTTVIHDLHELLQHTPVAAPYVQYCGWTSPSGRRSSVPATRAGCIDPAWANSTRARKSSSKGTS
jgi:hypothetical protein